MWLKWPVRQNANFLCKDLILKKRVLLYTYFNGLTIRGFKHSCRDYNKWFKCDNSKNRRTKCHIFLAIIYYNLMRESKVENNFGIINRGYWNGCVLFILKEMINYIKRHFKQNFYATDCSAIKRKAKTDVNIFFLLNGFIIWNI